MDKAIKAVFDTHKAADVVYCVGSALFTNKRAAENHASHANEKIKEVKREEAKKPAKATKKATSENK